MSITRLPSGMWRAQVYDPSVKRNVSVSRILGPPGTFATKREAKAAREDARARLGTTPTGPVTLGAWWETWTNDPLYQRPKQSTNMHNTERTRAFVNAHEHLRLDQLTDEHAAKWLAGGKRNAQVPALRAMLNDARSAKAGRAMTARNPFAGLGIQRTRGNAEKQPPSEPVVWELIEHARRLTCPSFTAWLQVAAFTGLRPGELDALRWDSVDLKAGMIRVREQWNAKSRGFTPPKNGQSRDAVLTLPARDALIALPREGEFVFTTLRGTHYTPSSRAFHWNSVRAAGGWTDTLYLATRHFAGWYMTNVLNLDSEVVAVQLGHTDGGELVRRLYGHRDKSAALRRVAAAFEQHGQVRPLRVVRKDTA